jgi:hypothetical protein
MMHVVLIAGIGLVLAGLVTVVLGIQLDLSLGNTLILTGAIMACTGTMLLGLWVLVRELRNIAGQLGSGMSLEPRSPLSPASAAPLFGGNQPAPDTTGHAEPATTPPWQAEAATRDRADIPPEPAEAAPPVKPRRNLLFSSSSRKERERAQARTPDPSVDDLPPAVAAAPPPESSEAPPVSFDDAWPKSERSRTPDSPPPPRRSGRTPSTFTEASAGTAAPERHPPAPRTEEPPPVTVLKSGVVDGMAYSLYSDGSIEAQMPEGMMRFASIDELRAHLDQRP